VHAMPFELGFETRLPGAEIKKLCRVIGRGVKLTRDGTSGDSWGRRGLGLFISTVSWRPFKFLNECGPAC
jgi:hypothetical protein